MGKILIISPEKCTGCRTCELACSMGKTSKINPQNSAVSVFQYEEAAISVPIMCMQCEDAACMKVCPVGALTKNEENNVVLNIDKCIGCKMCISACPFGNMSFNAEQKRVVKCDLCNGKPKCAALCPTGTIQYKDPSPTELSKKRLMADKFKELFEEVKK